MYSLHLCGIVCCVYEYVRVRAFYLRLNALKILLLIIILEMLTVTSSRYFAQF